MKVIELKPRELISWRKSEERNIWAQLDPMIRKEFVKPELRRVYLTGIDEPYKSIGIRASFEDLGWVVGGKTQLGPLHRKRLLAIAKKHGVKLSREALSGGIVEIYTHGVKSEEIPILEIGKHINAMNEIVRRLSAD